MNYRFQEQVELIFENPKKFTLISQVKKLKVLILP